MELYLSHMFVYRIFEKLNLIHMTGNEIVNYCLTAVMMIVGAVAVSFGWSKIQKRIKA